MKVHQAAEAFPMLSEPELLELARDIQENGLREPISVWNGAVLDGRNRLAACEIAGVEPRFADVEPVNGAVAFVVSCNLRRRHLNESQRALAAARLATLPRGSNQHASSEAPSQTAAAALLSVSRASVQRAKAVLESGDPDLVRDVEARDLSVSAAAALLRPMCFSSESVEWYTPTEHIAAARIALGGIDLDPATCAKAQQTVKAKKFFTRDDDGLSKPWRGRVWLNPPYGELEGGGSSVRAWSARLLEHYEAGDVTAAILCCNSFTDRGWFQPFWDHAICFARKRVKFYRPQGDRTDSPLHGSAFVYFGRDRDRFALAFAEIGPVVERRRVKKGRAA